MAKVRKPDLAAAGIAMPQGTPQGVAGFVWKGRYDLPLYLNTWDGYVAITLERDRADIDYIVVSTVLSETFTGRSVRRETVLTEQGTLRYA